MPKFKDIKTFPHCNYSTTVPWRYLTTFIAEAENPICGAKLDLNPDFQREHVWTEEQQIAYVEYVLKGDKSGKDLYFNCAGWGNSYAGPYVIVDGKQRLQAVRLFLADYIKVFGYYYHEYEDKLDSSIATFTWNIAALDTRKEVLEWYLAFNSSGVQHSKSELARVRELLKKEK